MTNPNIPFFRDAYDDLADLFLSAPAGAAASSDAAGDAAPLPFPGRVEAGEAVAPAPRQGAAIAPRIVGMMRVNLPVIAGPWLEQAAAAMALESGPAALIRVRGEHTCMDLIAPRDGQQAAAAALTSPAPTLPRAVQRLRGVISCWVVEVLSISESATCDWAGFDELVLLTGADEAAIVAVFGQIKAICSAASTLPRISLVVVGSDEETARHAAARIASASRESLDCVVDLRAIIRRMQPVPMRHLGRFGREEAIVETIAGVLRDSQPVPQAPPDAPAQVQTASVEDRAEPIRTRVALRPRLASMAPLDPPVPQVPPRQIAAPTTPAAAERAYRQDASIPPRPTPAAEASAAAPSPDAPVVPVAPVAPAPQSSDAGQTLVSLLSDLRPLEIDCPRAPGVEIAFDQHGRLHALAEDAADDAAIQRLLIACDWVREHRSLLTRLNPWLAAEPSSGESPVTLHLFTGRPNHRRHLADGNLRIHILVRDSRGGVVAQLDLN